MRHDPSNIERSNAVRLGALLDAGLQVGVWRAVFVEARYQLRVVGAFEAGRGTAGARGLPRSRVGLDHSYFGLGLGLRLG